MASKSKALYFDLAHGASGDMLLASLIDAGIEPGPIVETLGSLDISGWSISPRKIERYGLRGTSLRVECPDERSERHLHDIEILIRNSGLPDIASGNIIRVFRKLAAAEAAVHGTTADMVHFHEVGAMDSILDIAAFCIAHETLGHPLVYFSDIHFGTGTVHCRHGEIPVPAPAVVELARESRCRQTSFEGELITPTAAAILVTLGTQSLPPAGNVLKSSGIGFGTREYTFPSFTRLLLFDSQPAMTENAVMLECSIDDMNPQVYPRLIDDLLRAGAKDAFLTPVIMKKGRPGITVSVIAGEHEVPEVKRVLFRETTTIGLRAHSIARDILDRRYEEVSVSGQRVRVKVASMGGEDINAQPEFEDCRMAAEATGIPLREVIERAKAEYERARTEKELRGES